MKTYLGFKRLVTILNTGEQFSETKFIQVDIPELDEKDGWKLIGSSDVVEVIPVSSNKKSSDHPSGEQKFFFNLCSNKNEHETDKFVLGDSFESPVEGTARLIRRKNDIFIAFRKGKTTKNQTTPNSVCISDVVTSEFFTSCKKAYGELCKDYRFSRGSNEYNFWSTFIDNEYKKQLNEVNRAESNQ